MFMRWLLLFFLFPVLSWAHHNMACHLRYETVGLRKVKVTLTTYIDGKAKEYQDNPNDFRDSVFFFWGDQKTEWIKRTNVPGVALNKDVVKNIYVAEHEYAQAGNYKIGYYDQFRTDDIQNIRKGFSGVTLQYIEGVVPVHDQADSCINNSSYPLQDLYLFPKGGVPFEFNLAHYDPDGDSLAYELVDVKGKNKGGKVADEYFIPSAASIDEWGTFRFDSPGKDSIYVFAYTVTEYREGKAIGWTTVDFTLLTDFKGYVDGTFSNINGLDGNFLSFGAPGTKEVSFQFQNTNADTVIPVIQSGAFESGNFTLASKSSISKNNYFDTLSIDYLGNDLQNGSHPITIKIKNVFGSDTLYNYYSFKIRSDDFQTWSCPVPDIDYLSGGPSNITVNHIAPSVFQNSVYVNFGDDFESADLKIYDLRGRIVLNYKAFKEQVIQLDLSFLARAAYVAVFTNTNGVSVTQKIIKQ